MTKKLLFVVNVDWFFLSHRLPIALEALSQGYEVHLAAGITDKQAELQAFGLIVHPLSVQRGKLSLINELRLIVQIFSLFRKLKPDIVHLITNKPVIYGCIAARLLRMPAVVAAVPGLGFVFTSRSLKTNLLRIVVSRLYRIAFSVPNLNVIFQNQDDERVLKRATCLSESKIRIIRGGSGVDLAQYVYQPLPDGVPVVTMAARFLTDKGLYEFVEAARLLKQRGVVARFCLAGMLDPGNPASITNAELEVWKAENLVEILGYQSDIPLLFKSTHIVVLPSYREGFPKVLIEAAASGRAVITTDVPGCRDAISPDVTGILIPVRNALALAEAVEILLADPERCSAMGLAGRSLAEKEFDVRQVVKTHLDIYQKLLPSR